MNGEASTHQWRQSYTELLEIIDTSKSPLGSYFKLLSPLAVIGGLTTVATIGGPVAVAGVTALWLWRAKKELTLEDIVDVNFNRNNAAQVQQQPAIAPAQAQVASVLQGL